MRHLWKQPGWALVSTITADEGSCPFVHRWRAGRYEIEFDRDELKKVMPELELSIVPAKLAFETEEPVTHT
jgi:hypothetical protein